MGEKNTERVRAGKCFPLLEPQGREWRRNLFQLGWKERSWKHAQKRVTRIESGTISKPSLAEKIMWMATATEAGDSQPVVESCRGTGHEDGAD